MKDFFFSVAKIHSFFIDCQDDNSIFYSRKEHPWPRWSRSTFMYSCLFLLTCAILTLLGLQAIEAIIVHFQLFFLLRKIFYHFFSFNLRFWESIYVTNARRKVPIFQKCIRTLGTTRRHGKIWKIADAQLFFFLPQVSFIRQERNWSEYADLDARSSGENF